VSSFSTCIHGIHGIFLSFNGFLFNSDFENEVKTFSRLRIRALDVQSPGHHHPIPALSFGLVKGRVGRSKNMTGQIAALGVNGHPGADRDGQIMLQASV
jgi:hypothetical protein